MSMDLSSEGVKKILAASVNSASSIVPLALSSNAARASSTSAILAFVSSTFSMTSPVIESSLQNSTIESCPSPSRSKVSKRPAASLESMPCDSRNVTSSDTETWLLRSASVL
eukprot:Amastigsp_a334_18.p2 type:complete len:112 gc:universal Amastigsp_a334_18:489-154(-)